MELRNILEAFVGGLVALWLGPVALAAWKMFWAWLELRQEDSERELATRKAVAIVDAMRRNPGRKGQTWIIHDSSDFWMDFKKNRNSDGEDSCVV
jgi:hypothetical protein